MYENLYQIEDVKKFCNIEKFAITENEIETAYKKIPDPKKRINNGNKQWLIFDKENDIHTEIEKELKEILGVNEAIWVVVFKDNIKKAINKIGKLMIDRKIHQKPKIPFYVLVLNELE